MLHFTASIKEDQSVLTSLQGKPGRWRKKRETYINPLNTELNPICHLLALLGAHPILHISRIRVKVDG
jgi:hypothetical protein